MTNQAARQGAKPQGADLILMAMVADRDHDNREIGLIQQIYRDLSGRGLEPEEITAAAAAGGRDDGLLAGLAASADVLHESCLRADLCGR